MAAAGDDGERLAASVVVKVEVLAGMRPAEEHQTRRLLDALDWIPVDDDIAERAGLPANHYLPSHPGVDPVDHIIAATVELHDADLWTRNLKHLLVPRPRTAVLTDGEPRRGVGRLAAALSSPPEVPWSLRGAFTNWGVTAAVLFLTAPSPRPAHEVAAMPGRSTSSSENAIVRREVSTGG